MPNENELLYPYHKWLFAELGKATEAPENFLVDITKLDRAQTAGG